MSTTTIEWCKRPGTKPETWNPTTGCNKVSQGCKNCYAEVMHKRLKGMGQPKYQQPFLSGAVEHEDTLTIPLKWKTPRTVFVNSMSDLFHENVEFQFISDVWKVMANCPQHTFLILTKRPERLLMYSELISRWAPKNVWLGISCEDQATANERIPLLLQVPAAVRFLSCEPLLGKIDLSRIPHFKDSLNNQYYRHVLNEKSYSGNDCTDYPGKIDWVIAGGESGHGARPMHPDWVRSLRDQCEAAQVPFFFKQWGEWSTEKMFPGKRKNIAATFLNPQGHRCGFQILQHASQYYTTLYKSGKNNTGRKLDGWEWNGFPETEKIEMI